MNENSSPSDLTIEQVYSALKKCFDPEVPVNIVDLGLVYDVQIHGPGQVGVKMTLTSPGCGMGVHIARDAESKIKSLPGVQEAKVELVWDPPWNQHMISEEGRKKLGMA